MDFFCAWQYGVDPVRYTLLRDFQLAGDSDFAPDAITTRTLSDIADTFGNLGESQPPSSDQYRLTC